MVRKPHPGGEGRSGVCVHASELLLHPIPMSWASARLWQLCCGIAPRCIQLRLGEKDTFTEVGSSKVSISKVGSGKVGNSQVGSSKISSNEVCSSQVSSSKIGSFKFGPDEVGSSIVLLLVLYLESHEFACTQKQRIDVSSMCCNIQFHESSGAVVGEAFGLLQGEAQFIVERTGRLQRQGFGQIPEQFMEVPHDREHCEHLLCGLRCLPPVLSAEDDLRDLLPGTEAVVHGATPKALLPQMGVNATAKVRLQMRTRLSSVFRDREVGRG